MNGKKILIFVAGILILGGVVAAISDFNRYVRDLQASAAASDAHIVKVWDQHRGMPASMAASDAHVVKVWDQQHRAVPASMAASDAHMVTVWDQNRAGPASMAASDAHVVKVWDQNRAGPASMAASDAHMVKVWDQHRVILTVTGATEGFQSVAAAEAAGYVNINVGECVASSEGAMGYHFVNFELLDLKLDPQKPEIMVFTPEPLGGLRLGAVEYAVPIEPWDAIYESPPSILGQEMSPNPVLGLYVLHAWIYARNPSGIFADWNPSISCEV